MPLRGVELRLGSVRTRTNANGLFLAEGVNAGEAVLIIDGRQARLAETDEPVDHGVYEVRIHAEAGRTTALSWVSWLARIDHDNEVVLSVPAAEETVARAPSVPGLELRIPKGTILTGLDGEAVTRVGLTPIPVNRPPYPLPRHVAVPVYFTAQPGGAVLSSVDGQWLGAQVVYPNYGNDLPKARGTFWRYEPDSTGWSPYGAGTVSADARRVVPDTDTRIYALTGAMFSADAPPPAAPPPPLNPPYVPPPPPPPNPPYVPPPPPPPVDGDPVDLASGLYVERQTDLAISDLLPITVTRTYRPGDYNRRAFGIGMTLPYSMTLTSTQLFQKVDLIQADGSLVRFTRIIDPNNPSDNSYNTARFTTDTPGPFYRAFMSWNGNGGWTLTQTDGMSYTFPQYAPLQSMQDRFGNKISIIRDGGATSNIVQVVSSNGRFVRFTYDGGNRITQAVDNVGRTVAYAYDTTGRLATVTDANGGVTTYTWDSANRVQSIKDARGTTYITNTYDANDRITRQVLADGTAYQFVYTVTGTAPNTRVTAVEVTDPRGIMRRTTFSAAGYIVTDKLAAGTQQESTWTYTRDATSNLPTAIVDPLGRQTNQSYDARGNLLSITRLAGTANAATTSYSYTTGFNQIASVTDPLGHKTTYGRDSLDRLASVTNALSNKMQLTYDAQGRVLTLVDALGNTTTYGYGPDGDIASMTDPLGRKQRVFTDAIGRLVRSIDPLGGVTQWVHDPINGVRREVDANGAAIATAYTPIGKVASVTDPRNGTIAYTYGPRALMATRTDPLNAVEQVTQRDGMGNATAVTDRKGQATTSTYDALNRPTGATFAGGATLAWAWDLGNRLTQVQDSLGGSVTRAYDGLDRLTGETTPQGTVSYTYDKAGRRLTMQAGTQAQVSYAYDSADRLTGITQGANSVSFGYDAAGRRISASLPGGIAASYAWDVAGQLTGITYASGSTTLGTLTYGYDLAGRIASRGGTLFQALLPAAVTSASYDAANRLTTRTASGVTAQPSFDANGNLTSDGVRSYVWDARNRLSAITGVASFAYDGLNRRSTATRGGTATSFLYDGWDLVQERQGNTVSADLLTGLEMDERFSRNGLTVLSDQLSSTVALADAGTVQTRYGYDPYGASAQVTGTASDNPFQYTGREADGTGLLHYRNRYYHPAWGRFVSEDPLGLGGGDVNLYRYASNNPVQFNDPTGLVVSSPNKPSMPPLFDPAQYRCQNVDCGAPHGRQNDKANVCVQCAIKNSEGMKIILENGKIIRPFTLKTPGK